MSVNEIVPFNFNGNSVRVFVLDGEPWFVGKDITDILGYASPSQTLKDHCKSLKSLASIETIEANKFNDLPGNTLIIPERDVYRLIMRSRLPSAERFEEWVVGEVLPQIRKTGSYLPKITDPILGLSA